MRWFLLTFLFIFSTVILRAQEKSPSEPTERSLKSLNTISVPLDVALSDLEELQRELEQATTEDTKEEIGKRIDGERERIQQLRENFRSVLGGSEEAEYDGVPAEGSTVQEQISELIQPVLSEIREATAEPRELEALRKSLEEWQERKSKTDVVLARIDEISTLANTETVRSELDSARRMWTGRQSEANSKIAVLTVQIESRTREKRTAWETVSTGFSGFFKSRGMNLLFAVLAGALGFFITGKIYSWLRGISPIHKKEKNSFSSRMSDMLAIAAAVIVALGVVIAVFYFRGDWLLLTLVLIFLIGLAWAGKTAIPPYLDQIRMILNLGPVREGERVIYRDLPWKVNRLAFLTTFINPSLQAGKLRIPIREVMGMVSRPVEGKDVWFPSEADDWVVLSDGTYGKVIVQTPEQVVVLALGGSKKTYPTSEYLELFPENLSNGFRISVTFGIDYRHQSECTTTIPEIMETAITARLVTEFGRNQIHSVKVEFASASASSLDYAILADFNGSIAQKRNYLKRRIQQVCVESCNEHGWIIPFTQITVHNAENSSNES